METIQEAFDSSDVAPLLPGTIPDVVEIIVPETFKVKCIFGSLDGAYADADLLTKNPTPIYSEESDRQVGAACVAVEGDKVVGDLFFDRATPERLHIETRSIRLYAVLLAEARMRKPHPKRFEFTPPRADAIVVKGVLITRHPPLGAQTLGEPIL